MIKFLNNHWRFLISALIVLGLIYIRYLAGTTEQDNYLEYAKVFPLLKNLSYYDLRLFPGLPLYIYFLNHFTNNFLFSGYLVIFLSFAGSYWILYKMTGSNISFLPLMFPPAILVQATLISTEMLSIFLIVLSIYLLKNKKYFWSSLISGFSFWVRPIASLSFLGDLFVLLKLKNFKRIILNIFVFLFPISLFILFNSYFFGTKNIFYQFSVYRDIGHPVIGLVQIWKDIERTFLWHWFRILISGAFYLLLFLFLLIKIFKEKLNNFGLSILIIILGMTMFVFSFTSEPFLENLGRYLTPIFPLFWLIFYGKFKKEKIIYILIPISIIAVLL